MFSTGGGLGSEDGICLMKPQKGQRRDSDWRHKRQLSRNVERDISSARENNPTYDENKDVVGVDISYPKLKSESLINSGGEDFCLKLKSLNLF